MSHDVDIEEFKKLTSDVLELKTNMALMSQELKTNMMITTQNINNVNDIVKDISRDFKKLHGFWSVFNPKVLAIVISLLGVSGYTLEKAYEKPSPGQEREIERLRIENRTLHDVLKRLPSP